MSTRCNIEFYGDIQGEHSEPAARLYKHSDGYPSSIIPMLRKLERVLAKDIPLYGPRTDDPEWAAAEFISQYRVKSDAPKDPKHSWKHIGEGEYATQGNGYVSQRIHCDIRYLYRVVCGKKWTIHIFEPETNNTYDIVSFKEVTAEYSPKSGKQQTIAQESVIGGAA